MNKAFMKMQDFIPDCDICGKPMMKTDLMDIEVRPKGADGFSKTHRQAFYFVCVECPTDTIPLSYGVLVPDLEVFKC